MRSNGHVHRATVIKCPVSLPIIIEAQPKLAVRRHAENATSSTDHKEAGWVCNASSLLIAIAQRIDADIANQLTMVPILDPFVPLPTWQTSAIGPDRSVSKVPRPPRYSKTQQLVLGDSQVSRSPKRKSGYRVSIHGFAWRTALVGEMQCQPSGISNVDLSVSVKIVSVNAGAV